MGVREGILQAVARYGIGDGQPMGATGEISHYRFVDALSDAGVTHLDMPATPERVWGAIRAAQAEARGMNDQKGR